MTLPSFSLATDKVEIEGQVIEVTALTRADALVLHGMVGKPDDAENHVIAKGCGVTLKEAREWRASVPSQVAEIVSNKILEMSGLLGAATFPDDG